MREFVREEIYPLETLDLDHHEFRQLIKPLQEEVKEQGLWAAHLGPELGGQGMARSSSASCTRSSVVASSRRTSSAARHPTPATPS